MIKIDLYVTERKTKDNQPFKAFHTYDKHAKRLQVKFTRSCNVVPDKNCQITIFKGNVAKSGKYPILWIDSYGEMIPQAEIESNLNDFFDEDNGNKD